MQENSKIGRSLKQISQPVQKRERWLTLTTKKPRPIAKVIPLTTSNLNRNLAYPAEVRNFPFSLSPKTMYRLFAQSGPHGLGRWVGPDLDSSKVQPIDHLYFVPVLPAKPPSVIFPKIIS